MGLSLPEPPTSCQRIRTILTLLTQEESNEAARRIKSHFSELLRAYCWSGISHSWSHGALAPKGLQAPRREEPEDHCLHTYYVPATSTCTCLTSQPPHKADIITPMPQTRRLRPKVTRQTFSEPLTSAAGPGQGEEQEAVGRGPQQPWCQVRPARGKSEESPGRGGPPGGGGAEQSPEGWAGWADKSPEATRQRTFASRGKEAVMHPLCRVRQEYGPVLPGRAEWTKEGEELCVFWGSPHSIWGTFEGRVGLPPGLGRGAGTHRGGIRKSLAGRRQVGPKQAADRHSSLTESAYPASWGHTEALTCLLPRLCLHLHCQALPPTPAPPLHAVGASQPPFRLCPVLPHPPTPTGHTEIYLFLPPARAGWISAPK